MVCQNYCPPEGYVPNMSNPLLDHCYGKYKTAAGDSGCQKLRVKLERFEKERTFSMSVTAAASTTITLYMDPGFALVCVPSVCCLLPVLQMWTLTN